MPKWKPIDTAPGEEILLVKFARASEPTRLLDIRLAYKLQCGDWVVRTYYNRPSNDFRWGPIPEGVPKFWKKAPGLV